MQVFTYSGPEFNPYDDGDLDRRAARSSEPGPWLAPTASGPLDAVVPLPGSKSLTNRELVLSALAVGPSNLFAPLHARDTALMVEALRSLGTSIEETDVAAYGRNLRITPGELEGGTSIDCGLAGTVMRFLPPVAALALGPIAFDGDAAARLRPMRITIESLRGLGVDVSDDGRGKLPFSLYGTGAIDGGDLGIDASASSQFVSGLLLAAPRFTRGLRLRHTGATLPSLPHIDMTVAALRARGVDVECPEPGLWVVHPGPIAGRDVLIEPDLSNAAPFLIAAIVAGGEVTVPFWPDETTQVGADLEHILPRFGARIRRSPGSLTIDGGVGIIGGATFEGLELDLSTGGELAPALVALTAFASSPSRGTGIGHLRGHETDRLAALAADLTALGASVTEFDDGLSITPGVLAGGPWAAYADHRMAHAGAIIGLAVPGVLIDDIATTAKTMPEFAVLWSSLVAGSPLDTGVPRSPVDPLSIL